MQPKPVPSPEDAEEGQQKGGKDMARKKVTEQVLSSWDEVNEALRVIGQAQDEIASFIQENQAEAYEIVANALDLEVSAVEDMVQYYDFSTETTEKDKEGFKKTADFMFETGMIETELDVNTLFYE